MAETGKAKHPPRNQLPLSAPYSEASPLDGEGSRRAGGRWNVPGLGVVCAASTLSLAVLQLLVHADPASVPDDLVALEVEIPDDLRVER